MGKFANDLEMDAALDYIAASDIMVVCINQPATYADARGAQMLAEVAMAGGDYAKANGDASGRKVTTAAKNAVAITNPGNAQHIALVRVADTSLRFVTTCTLQALVAGGTVDIPAWKDEIADPA